MSRILSLGILLVIVCLEGLVIWLSLFVVRCSMVRLLVLIRMIRCPLSLLSVLSVRRCKVGIRLLRVILGILMSPLLRLRRLVRIVLRLILVLYFCSLTPLRGALFIMRMYFLIRERTWEYIFKL